MPVHILVVEDEAAQRELLCGFLGRHGYLVHEADSAETGLALFEKQPIDIVLLDYKLPGMSGAEALYRMKAIKPIAKALVITAYGDVETAVSVMKMGAEDFITKPLSLPSLLNRLQELEEALAVEKDVAMVQDSMEEAELPFPIVTASQAMKEVVSFARRVATSPWTVLIRGETGTGKELVARIIHLLSKYNEGPFIEVNCAALPESLFESELFGHEKGAFTGATSQRKGRFELAEEGSVFLDEVGELPLHLQPKILRVLQEKTLFRVGGEKPISLQVRLIVATNRDLGHMVANGMFRKDLYFRLKVLELEIPPLRERKEDLPPLIALFLKKYSSRPIGFAPEAMDRVLKYPFPGNVRELENIIQRAVTLTRGPLINIADLPPEVRHSYDNYAGKLHDRLAVAEKEMIIMELENCGWVQTKAAEALGISERVLRYRMAKLGIHRPDTHETFAETPRR